MSIVERVRRVNPFSLKRRLDKQLTRLEGLEEKAVERGMAPLAQIDFTSAEEEQWDRTALRELERATDEELNKLFDGAPRPLLISIVREWKHNLQKQRNSLG